MTASFAELKSAADTLPDRPVAFVLGSGLGPVAARVTPRVVVGFADIPALPIPTVAGHGGTLMLGEWAGRPVLVFAGRLHFYEGHPWDHVVQPIDLLVNLSARAVVLTNAAGGINPALEPGSLMAITDHLEWNVPHHWRSPGKPSPYDPRLNQSLHAAAERCGVALHKGVYAVVTGPNYETPAEVRALAAYGADAVGMSTAREARRAHEMGLPVAAVSCVANRAAGLSATPLCHREVLEAVSSSADRLGRLLEEFLRRIDHG